MIFIGAELSDPHAHFVTNIVACIGSGDDLVIDLLKVKNSEEIFNKITGHLRDHDEGFVIYNAYTDENFFISLRKRFPRLRLITVFSDDEWRHANYDRYLALYSDIFTIAVKSNLDAYRQYGLDPFYLQWACNPEMFYPLHDQCKDIDVSFIGAAYGQRTEYIRFLVNKGIQVKVFGRGWKRYSDIRPYWGGYLSNKEMLEVISRSKINLNFLWTSAEKEKCTIKGRTLELSACRTFQLSNHTDEFVNYGFVDGENITVFRDEKDALDKIQYYLDHDAERKDIAYRAYEHVLQNHTWQQRFQAIFAREEKNSTAPYLIQSKPRIMVIARDGVQHQIRVDDDRLDICFSDPESDWQIEAAGRDGVIWLDHDSTLNNESLYMMAFGLMADQSDIITANFYVGSKKNPTWIRVIDRMVEQRQTLLEILPAPCLMFSGAYAAKHGCNLAFNINQIKISYIEYPSFWIDLSYYQSRKLRLYFAYHGDSRQSFKEHIRSLKIGKALSLIVDKLWQIHQKKRW